MWHLLQESRYTSLFVSQDSGSSKGCVSKALLCVLDLTQLVVFRCLHVIQFLNLHFFIR